MKPITLQDIANLPAAYNVEPDFAEYAVGLFIHVTKKKPTLNENY